MAESDLMDTRVMKRGALMWLKETADAAVSCGAAYTYGEAPYVRAYNEMEFSDTWGFVRGGLRATMAALDGFCPASNRINRIIPGMNI